MIFRDFRDILPDIQGFSNVSLRVTFKTGMKKCAEKKTNNSNITTAIRAAIIRNRIKEGLHKLKIILKVHL